MNPTIEHLYTQWLAKTDGDAGAAAVLTAAELQTQPANQPAKRQTDLLTVRQAAVEFNVSERALYRLTSLHRRNGRSVRISRRELVDHLEGTRDLMD
jgi:Helix-turn-helix domain